MDGWHLASAEPSPRNLQGVQRGGALSANSANVVSSSLLGVHCAMNGDKSAHAKTREGRLVRCPSGMQHKSTSPLYLLTPTLYKSIALESSFPTNSTVVSITALAGTARIRQGARPV